MPPNVSVFTNLPAPKTWAVLAGAKTMVLPLRDARAACGHITLVAAKLLGIPIIVTDSVGIRDYTDGGRVAALVPPGSAEAIEVALDRVLGDDVQRQQARTGVALARQEHDPQLWLDYVNEKAALLGPVG
jgi:glycosyltransferase involved in cell wall biosynthesis